MSTADEIEIEIYNKKYDVWLYASSRQLAKGVRFRRINEPEVVLIVTGDEEVINEYGGMGVPVKVERH